jgi:hypothetical protein
MDNDKCPAFVNDKKCGLALALVEQDVDTEMEVYECPLGHRVQFLLGEAKRKQCAALVESKPCGLELSVVEQERETATEIYECPLGHRTYAPLEPPVMDDDSP